MEIKSLDNKYEYTAEVAAVNLVEFLRGVPTIKCGIGEISKDKYGGDALIAVGAEVRANTNPSYFLANMSSTVEIDSFKAVAGMNPKSMLNLYYSKNPDLANEKQEIASRLKNIANHKELVNLFKVGETMGADPEIAKRVFGVKNVTLTGCLWKMNLQTGKFESSVVLSGDSKQGTRVSVEEYGSTFILKRLEGESGKEMIKVSRFGYILPVEITDGKITYAMDRKYLYRVFKGSADIVGRLLEDKIEYVNPKEFGPRSKIGKCLSDTYGYYIKHREFIVPYGLVEAHKVTV